LYRQQDDGPWELLRVLPPNTTILRDSSVSYQRATDYRYRVVGHHNGRQSEPLTGPFMRVRHVWGWPLVHVITGAELRMYFGATGYSPISNHAGNGEILVQVRIDSMRVSRDTGNGFEPIGLRVADTTPFADVGLV